VASTGSATGGDFQIFGYCGASTGSVTGGDFQIFGYSDFQIDRKKAVQRTAFLSVSKSEIINPKSEILFPNSEFRTNV
jgi:hypothetical protein